ncbi:MAG: TetR/AcrR family transcriptional regulator [Sneathiellales bacterium]|nr:TetR/AcrR family transcriptional regulator [Sneathiellales bacterium]
MAKSEKKRIRRAPAEARAHVIKCAEALLIEGGAAAVQMRSVARKAGITDAGIAHHYKNREGLLNALMDHGANKVRTAIDTLVNDWVRDGTDVASLVSELGELYSSGYAELALQVYGSGWQERGEPLLEPVIEALWANNQNPATDKEEVRLCFASLHMWLALDPLFGKEFRNSAGLGGKRDRVLQEQWWIKQMNRILKKPEDFKER